MGRTITLSSRKRKNTLTGKWKGSGFAFGISCRIREGRVHIWPTSSDGNDARTLQAKILKEKQRMAGSRK